MRKAKGGLNDLKALYKEVQAEKSKHQKNQIPPGVSISNDEILQRENDLKLFARATQAVVPMKSGQARLRHSPTAKPQAVIDSNQIKRARALGDTPIVFSNQGQGLSDGPELYALASEKTPVPAHAPYPHPPGELAYAATGIGPDTTRRLKQAFWPVGAQLDLHGFTKDQARAALTQFIDQSQQFGARCVKIIHGVGHGSAKGQPVLKNLVAHWLTQLDTVQAYTTAPLAHGGKGALLVLIRLS